MSPLRHTHKLRAYPKRLGGEKVKLVEYIVCTGREDRFEIARWFWDNVSCPDCRAKRKVKVR